MINKIDDIIRRLGAVFLFPLINILMVTLIVYSVTSTDKHTIMAAASSASSGIIGALTELIEKNLTAIADALKAYKDAVQTISSILAATVFLVVVILVYLVDRTFFYIGYFMPPNFKFDLRSYETKAREGRDRALKKIFKRPCDIVKIYGTIGAYLSHKNADQYRLARRNELVAGIEHATKIGSYVKAYTIFIVMLLIASAVWSVRISPAGTLAAVLALAIVFLVKVWYVSRCYRALVNFDLDCFIWERSYNSAATLDAGLLEGAAIPSDPPNYWLSKWLQKNLYLRIVVLDTGL